MLGGVLHSNEAELCDVTRKLETKSTPDSSKSKLTTFLQRSAPAPAQSAASAFEYDFLVALYIVVSGLERQKVLGTSLEELCFQHSGTRRCLLS